MIARVRAIGARERAAGRARMPSPLRIRHVDPAELRRIGSEPEKPPPPPWQEPRVCAVDECHTTFVPDWPGQLNCPEDHRK